MTPLGHLSLALIAGHLQDYDGRDLSLCLIASVLPDVIDKSLWRIGPFITGHTLAHSVLTFSVVSIMILALPRLRRLTPFIPGYGAHILADLMVAYPKFMINYFWPLLPQRPTPDGPAVDYWINYAASAPGVVEIISIAIGTYILIHYRFPHQWYNHFS